MKKQQVPEEGQWVEWLKGMSIIIKMNMLVQIARIYNHDNSTFKKLRQIYLKMVGRYSG